MASQPFAGDEPSDRRVFPGGRFVATATSVRTLIRIAFGTDDNRMSGAPRWIDNETFDINATTAGHAEVKTPPQFQQLILSLLEDRFQLRFHREQEEGAVYWLELDQPGKLGPALKLSTPEIAAQHEHRLQRLKGRHEGFEDVRDGHCRRASPPGRSSCRGPTDLKGSFDFQIEWAPEETADTSTRRSTPFSKNNSASNYSQLKASSKPLSSTRSATPPPTNPRPLFSL